MLDMWDERTGGVKHDYEVFRTGRYMTEVTIPETETVAGEAWE